MKFIYFNRTEDIIVQSHLNPEAQVFVPSVKVCIFIKQVLKKYLETKYHGYVAIAIGEHSYTISFSSIKYHLYNILQV